MSAILARSNSPDSIQNGYFSKVRKEILPLIPTGIHTLLDVGCGEGATAQWLLGEGFCQRAFGIEHDGVAASKAALVLETIKSGDVETLDLSDWRGSMDAILCLDVLEHLRDPWATLRKLKTCLRENGSIIASIPNVRNASILLPLLWRGEWEYTSEGLLDRTHLRFFTRKTAIELMASCGLNVDFVGSKHGPKRKLIDMLTFGRFGELSDIQYLIRART